MGFSARRYTRWIVKNNFISMIQTIEILTLQNIKEFPTRDKKHWSYTNIFISQVLMSRASVLLALPAKIRSFLMIQALLLPKDEHE